jgi:hypothetical protein
MATAGHQIEIWTGGQTGVDRAALDAAVALGLPTAGWIPLDRLAEDGHVPARYASLRETDSPDYSARTRRNVRDTDATLVLRFGTATGGTLETLEAVRRLHRPVLDIDLATTTGGAAGLAVRKWLEELLRVRPAVRLNVAGPRASQAPTAYACAKEFLLRVFSSFAASAGQAARARPQTAGDQMPFKSKAQRRKFAELLVKGEISPETYEEWNRKTGRAKLPERVHPKARTKTRRKANTKRALPSKRRRPKAKTRAPRRRAMK